MLETITLFLGIPVAIVGAFGGWLTVRSLWESRALDRRPHGDKGVTFLVLSVRKQIQHQEITVLIAGDAVHLLRGMLTINGSSIETFQSVGTYYLACLRAPPEASLQY